MTISHSNLSFASLNGQYFLHLGLCHLQITELIIRNSSLDHVTIGGQMTKLRRLDLRQNDVNTLNRPDSDSIEAIYLSGDLILNLKTSFPSYYRTIMNSMHTLLSKK